MNFTQLNSFTTIARAGSFTAAAEKLFLTQPALSLQIKELEKNLGERLFEREGRRLQLTYAGELLMKRAEQILGLVEQTYQEVASSQGLRAGKLVIGTNDTYALHVLPSLLASFRHNFPKVALVLITRKSSEVVTMVKEGTVNFGIATLPLLDPQIQTQRLFWREDVAIFAPNHPLAERHSILSADLAEHPLLLLDKRSTGRYLLEQYFAEVGQAPEIMELGSIEVIKRMVGIGLGVSVVPGFAVREELRVGSLKAARLPWLPARTVGLIQRRNGYLPPAGLMFLRLLKNHIPLVLLSPFIPADRISE